MGKTKSLLDTFVTGGIQESFDAPKARAIRLANVITISAVLNCVGYGVIFWFLKDSFMLRACVDAALVYGLAYVFIFIGWTYVGRALSLISGNLIVFWFACQFRGESLLQLFLYSLSVIPFMFFSWEERKWYALTLLSVFLLIFGEVHSYHFFTVGSGQYHMTALRIFSNLAPLYQIIGGFFYFLKQSVKYEEESNENLRKLEMEYQNQLHVQKMSSLGEMASGIAHEINNPLSIISLKTSLIRKTLTHRLPEADPVFTNIDKISTTIERIAKIIRALRSYSRDAAHDPFESVDVEQVIDETLELCRQRFINAGIQLELKIEGSLRVLCRPGELSQVILNLLNNAYDAVSGTKNATVEIKSRMVNATQVEILIEDNGMGIPEAIEDKIFQPFFTTKEVGKGTGLGLSLSRGIVESHDGTLSLIRARDKTIFQILMPALNRK